MDINELSEKIDKLSDASLAHKVLTIENQCWSEALAELVINHIAGGDQEQKNLLYLQLEKNYFNVLKEKGYR